MVKGVAQTIGESYRLEGPKTRNLLMSIERGVLLRIEAAAILLGIGRTTMYDLIGRGGFPLCADGADSHCAHRSAHSRSPRRP